MKEVSNHLREVLASAQPILEDISAVEARLPPAPGKWSPIQIIGHLNDSACNNQMKFVRLLREEQVQVSGYQQDDWVALQQYHKAPWADVLQLWLCYNRHLAHVIQHIPAPAHSHELYVDGVGPFRLDFIVPDYVEHLKHHLLQIDENMSLQSEFKNVY